MPKTQPKILALAVLCALALPGAAWADCPWGGSVAGYLGCEFDELQGLLLDVEESLSAEVGLVQDSRQAVSSCETVLDEPGSYYLNQNLVCGAPYMYGVDIRSDDVTLDLNGFSILGAHYGVQLLWPALGGENVTVRNGTIRGGLYGIHSYAAGTLTVEDMKIMDTTYGIEKWDGQLVVRSSSLVGQGADSGAGIRAIADEADVVGLLIEDSVVTSFFYGIYRSTFLDMLEPDFPESINGSLFYGNDDSE